jgi:hypothetical protein
MSQKIEVVVVMMRLIQFNSIIYHLCAESIIIMKNNILCEEMFPNSVPDSSDAVSDRKVNCQLYVCGHLWIA